MDTTKLLLTGADSQIGLGLRAQLADRTFPITAISRHKNGSSDEPITWIRSDLEQPNLSLAGYSFDVLVHMAALWLLPDHLPALAGAGVKRIIAFGSTSTTAKKAIASPSERAIVRRLELAEEKVRQDSEAFGMTVSIFKPTLIYGRGLDQNISQAARMIARLGWFPLSLGARGLRQPLHADDIAPVILNAVDASDKILKPSYYLAGAETLAYDEMIGRLFDVQGLRRRRVPVPGLSGLLGLAGMVFGRSAMAAAVARRMRQDQVFDYTDAARDLGFRPRAFLADGARLSVRVPEA